MNFFKKIIFISVISYLFIPSFALVYAQASGGGNPTFNPAGSGKNTVVPLGSGNCGSPGSGLQNPLGNKCDLYQLISAIIDKVFLPIGGVLAVFFIIYSGFLLVTSAGNEEKLKTGKKTLVWALIGSAILLGSWVIAKGIENTINEIKRTSIQKGGSVALLDK